MIERGVLSSLEEVEEIMSEFCTYMTDGWENLG
jgi:hypothetical protein